MRKYSFHTIFLLIVSLFSFTQTISAQATSDTIFYNKYWRICEKPFASYYRIGTLVIDSFWMYTGKVKDYTIENKLVMEGNYNDEGLKNGTFTFYYPNGNLQASGEYVKDRMFGFWEWNYENGFKKALINFPGNGAFEFVSYFNKDGKETVKWGEGDLMWFTDAFTGGGFQVEGSVKKGLREGRWHYYEDRYGTGMTRILTEIYSNGNFKKGIYINSQMNFDSGTVVKYKFEPAQIKIIDDLNYDEFFMSTGSPAAAGVAISNYIHYRQPIEIFLKDSTFESAMAHIAGILRIYRDKIDYAHKEIDGSINFKVSNKGFVEDLTINGDCFTPRETEFLTFLMRKFRNIEMPGTDRVAIEGYHTIYLYTMDLTEFLPAEYRRHIDRGMFILPFKKDQFIQNLKSNKKDIKNILRELYWD